MDDRQKTEDKKATFANPQEGNYKLAYMTFK